MIGFGGVFNGNVGAPGTGKAQPASLDLRCILSDSSGSVGESIKLPQPSFSSTPGNGESL
jgi:hypothetical protein